MNTKETEFPRLPDQYYSIHMPIPLSYLSTAREEVAGNFYQISRDNRIKNSLLLQGYKNHVVQRMKCGDTDP